MSKDENKQLKTEIKRLEIENQCKQETIAALRQQLRGLRDLLKNNPGPLTKMNYRRG